MKLQDLLTLYIDQLQEERDLAMTQGFDAPVDVAQARHLRTIGTLHIYALSLPNGHMLTQDLPITILPSNNCEPTEGIVLGTQDGEVLVQTFDAFGETVHHCTVVPDTSGFLETAITRLSEMSTKPESFTLGPAERLVPWLNPDENATDPGARANVSASVLSTMWHADEHTRHTHIGSMLVDHARQNKRVLVMGPDHESLDRLLGFIAKKLQNAALPFKSLLSRYELAIQTSANGIDLQEIGFESHMHQFYAKANSHKVLLRKKYERFRELTPILAYKRDKQRDLNEVKLLEWRLLTSLSEWQGKIKSLDKTVADYEAIPIWKRLAMQAAGKNVETLKEYRLIYEQKIHELMREVEIAQQRIRELVPEATIPKDMRPEYDELKEEIAKLGGTRKIREMLAAGEGTNRQAFIQNKRIVATTASRVLTDPIFRRTRFDMAIIADAPKIPAPCLLGASGLIRERIVLCGDSADLQAWTSGHKTQAFGKWPQTFLPGVASGPIQAAQNA
ncbi:MAG: hypothetical protein MRJ96_16725 [Nitrospirales bacterium]|nr:hypothetical protein [Nitrospira sp.]MDR4503090.1 hypothetical protein [Nitrospirales bacterium]